MIKFNTTKISLSEALLIGDSPMFIVSFISMPPADIMTTLHLWLQEASELLILRCPSHTVAGLDTALDERLIVDDSVDIEPNTVLQDHVQLLTGILILLLFSTGEFTPETFSAPMAVLRQRPGTNRHLRGVVRLLIEAVFELMNVRPDDVLRAESLTVTQHRKTATRTDAQKELFD